MSTRYPGGIITKTPVVPTTSAAPGIWTLDQALTYIRAGTWPYPGFIGGPHWIGRLTGSQTEDNSIGIDSSGNVYLCGYSEAAGTRDFQIAKYNSSGVIQWQRRLGTAGSDRGNSIAVSPSGNVYVCGFAYAGVEFRNDLITAKYDTSGAIQWQRRLGYTVDGSSIGLGISLDSSENVYVIGYSYAAGAASEAIQIAKYNTSGTIQWQRYLNGSLNEEGQGIAASSSGNVYICGVFNASSSGAGFIIAKYDTSGAIQWQRRLGGDSTGSNGRSVAIDSSENVYVAGSGSTLTMQIAKYDTSGTLQWQRELAAAAATSARSISVDNLGNVYVCGYGDVAGNNVIYIAKYSDAGTIQWQRSLSSSTIGLISFGSKGIAADGSGNIYVGGALQNTAFLFAKLLGDGSLTGTYTVGGTSITYAASSLTAATSTLAATTPTLTDAASSLTESASSLTDAATTLTSSVTTI